MMIKKIHEAQIFQLSTFSKQNNQDNWDALPDHVPGASIPDQSMHTLSRLSIECHCDLIIVPYTFIHFTHVTQFILRTYTLDFKPSLKN